MMRDSCRLATVAALRRRKMTKAFSKTLLQSGDGATERLWDSRLPSACWLIAAHLPWHNHRFEALWQ